MKIFAVGERKAILGLRLAGIQTVLETSSPQEAIEYVKKISTQDDAAIVIVTHSLYDQIEAELREIRRRKMFPVFFRLPEINLEV